MGNMKEHNMKVTNEDRLLTIEAIKLLLDMLKDMEDDKTPFMYELDGLLNRLNLYGGKTRTGGLAR